MTLRFRRSIRMLPGLRLNLGKRGASVSLGDRGAQVTMGHGQLRETVGLPGTGLSYTHVDGHQSAVKVSGEAQTPPVPDVPSPGSAWRGWLWAAAFVAIAVASVCLLASCGDKPPPPAVLAPGIGPPIKRDPGVVYDLREKCGRDAQAWYHHYYEENVTKVPGYSLINSSFTSHYNERLNQCFAVVNSLTSSRDEKTKAVKFFDNRTLANVLENRDLGTFDKFSDMDRAMGCSVGEKNCTNAQEWEDLTKPFMEK
jgi:Protein of unknown function (DUF4236)